MANRRVLACRECGQPATADNDIHCGDVCRQALAAKRARAEQALRDAGFSAHPEAPNLWRKDGAGTTLEEVTHHGIEEVLQRHKAAARS